MEESAEKSQTQQIRVLAVEKHRLEVRLKELEERCSVQAKIIESGNLSTMQTLLDQFMTFSRIQLKKISTEALLSEFDPISAELLWKFLDYLSTVHSELAQFLVHSKGIYPAEWLKLKNLYVSIGTDIDNSKALSRSKIRKIRIEIEKIHSFISTLSEKQT